MKRKLINLPFVIITLIFLSCNSAPDKKADNTATAKDSTTVTTETNAVKDTSSSHFEPEDCDDLTGADNVIVNTNEAIVLRDNFSRWFPGAATPGKHLTTNEWIDANVIIAFANLFRYHEQYDGVRFIFSAKSTNAETSFIMVPTTPVTPTPTNPNDNSHLNSWVNIPLPTNESVTFTNFALGRQKTTERMELYDELYRRNFTCNTDGPCLSSSVWMSKCVILALAVLIEDENNAIDGIRAWNAAYSDLVMGDRNIGQVSKKQSTVILVPTHKNGNEHEDDWNLIPDRSYSLIKDKRANKKFDAGLNHGQLCPQICE